MTVDTPDIRSASYLALPVIYSGTARLFCFISLTMLAWTLAITFARWPLPVYDDMLEAWSWGQQWQPGYYKHPPFYAWVTAAWFQIWPRSDWAFYLLAYVNVGLGLVGVWMLARRMLTSRFGAAASVVLLTLTPFYNVMASNFNANTVLLSLWPWTIFIFVRVLQTRSSGLAVVCGFLAACSMLSKYSSILLLASCLMAACLHPDRRKLWRGPAAYVGVTTCVCLLLPHLWWSVTNDFPTIRYALTKTARPFPDGLFKAVETTFAVVVLLAVPALVCRLALRRSHNGSDKKLGYLAFGALEAQSPWFIALAAGPLVLTVLPAFVGLTKASLNFTIPTFCLLPILVVSIVEKHLTDAGMRAIWLAGWVVPIVALSVAPVVGALTLLSDAGQSTRYNAIAARRAAVVWQASYGYPVRIVSGTEPFSLAQPFYNRDAPQEFSHFSHEEAPWVTRADIERDGLLSICEVTDLGCRRNAIKFASASTTVLGETLQLKFLGVLLRPVQLLYIMTPPQRYLPVVSPGMDAAFVNHR